MKAKTLQFTVPDMSCASCVAHIEHALKKMDGVKNASVNFATNKVQVTFDPHQVSVADLEKAVQKAGYTPEFESAPMDHSQHAKAEDSTHLKSRRNGLIFAFFLSSLIFLFGFGVKLSMGPELMMIASLLLLVFPGKEFFKKGIPSLLKGQPGMDSLVALGVGTAFVFSSYQVLFTETKVEYFMDTAVITSFILLGRYLEALAKGRAGEAIQKLLELSPKVAHQVTPQGVVDIPVEDIQIGALLVVKAGEKIPVDGVLVEGSAWIDESMVTGESQAVHKEKGSAVIGATINGDKLLRMEAKKVGKDTLLAQIIQLVEAAQMSKAPIQKLVDKVAGYFVWGVLLIAIVTLVVWYGVAGEISKALIYTVSVLIIACPCALGLATPISIVVGSGKGAKMGILLKNAASLETMHQISTICFDKTGTLTKGHPEVRKFVNLHGHETHHLKLALALEALSEHPLAKSIVDFAASKKVKADLKVKDLKSVKGRGLMGEIEGKRFYMGSLKYMKELKVDLEKPGKDMEQLEASGHTVLALSNGKEVLAYFGVKDALKDSSLEALRLLRERQIKTVMITGDNASVAAIIAKEVGIDAFHASVDPKEKLAIIAELQNQGEVVAMVGDGINDSPALAKADVGIAMGTGTDIAMESGDVVLVKGDLLKAVEAIALSEATLKNIRQNLFWAFIYNTIGIPLAAFGLLNPMISAVAMAASSVSVVFNALRLRRFRV